MANLWLDDVRQPWKFGKLGWEWCKNYEQAVALLKTGKVQKASLDHDLDPWATIGEKPHEKTGYDVLCWLEQHPQYLPPEGITVHSFNPAGRARMEKLVDRLYRLHGRKTSG